MDDGKIQRERVKYGIYYAGNRYTDFENYMEVTKEHFGIMSDYGSPIIMFYSDNDGDDIEWSYDDHNEVVRWMTTVNSETLELCLAELARSQMWESSKEMYKMVIETWFDPKFLHLRPFFVL